MWNCQIWANLNEIMGRGETEGQENILGINDPYPTVVPPLFIIIIKIYFKAPCSSWDGLKGMSNKNSAHSGDNINHTTPLKCFIPP